jgi:Universal stress protein family
VGSRGQGALSAALLGSVSREILHKAKRPVVVVRAGALVHGYEPAAVTTGVKG